MIQFKSYRELLNLLFNKEHYFTYKNKAENISLDYVLGKEKTKVTVSFEIKTNKNYATKKKIKEIKNKLKGENKK